MIDPEDASTDIVEEKRRLARDSLFLTAHLRFGDEDKIREVRIRNLSAEGLMVELDRASEVGTPVVLDLRGIGEVSGKIAWYTTGRAGIALDFAIDPKKARKPVGATRTAPLFHAKGTPPR
ncbi:MAG TPA: PilZ domain-containing protein [Sphingomonas sp.]|nr:PilZ domain-containing protein [Sphingomonas sp.]